MILRTYLTSKPRLLGRFRLLSLNIVILSIIVLGKQEHLHDFSIYFLSVCSCGLWSDNSRKTPVILLPLSVYGTRSVPVERCNQMRLNTVKY